VSALRALYAYAIDQRQVEFNPADGLVMPRVHEPVRTRSAGLRDDAPEREDPPQWTRPRDAGRARRDAGRARREPREPSAFEPIARVPERILSVALKAVFVLFALVAVITLLESL
jgi:hypothetical protein